MIVELNENNFEENIATGLKLIIFSTTWCHYCQMAHEVLNELQDIWIGRVDGDKSLNLVQKYRIAAFPTFLLFKNGELLITFSGYRSKSDLMNILMNYI